MKGSASTEDARYLVIPAVDLSLGVKYTTPVVLLKLRLRVDVDETLDLIPLLANLINLHVHRANESAEDPPQKIRAPLTRYFPTHHVERRPRNWLDD